MRNLILLALFPLLALLSTSLGIPFLHIFSSPALPSHPVLVRKSLFKYGSVKLNSFSSSFTRAPRTRCIKTLLEPAIAPAPSPTSRGSLASPSSGTRPRHHHHRKTTHAISPAPSTGPGCSELCPKPLTSTPIHSTCGCVLPMKVRFLLDASLLAIFPMSYELEREIAEGTYLKQSQVVLTGAYADANEQTTMDFDLLPLEEKFDNTTTMLIYERLWYKKVPINKTLFGDYEIAYIIYPGLPSSPPYWASLGPSGSAGNQQFPVSADLDDKSHKLNSRTVFVIIVSGLVVLVVCFGVLSIFVRYKNIGRPSNAVGPVFTPSKKRSGKGTGYLSSTPESLTSASLVSSIPTSLLSVKTFSIVELEKATDKFSSKRVLGEGGFGRVYHGITEDGTEIAVKLLTRDIKNRDREFVAEVEMLSRLHHRNLVKLIGICIEGHICCLVYEVVPNGSVESHLHGADKAKGPLDWDTRLKIALGSARGLAYLHEDSNPRVIHRDFKASNVLLEDDFTPKVSDFGLAREATEGSNHISTRVMGTFGYVAPEYAMTGHLLVKSDVYSYGVVLLELLSGRKPVDMSQPYGQENLVTWARPLLTTREGLEQLVDSTLAGTYEFDDMAKVAAIAFMCVNAEVTHRPFMGEVVQAVKLIYNDNSGSSHRASSALGSDFKADHFTPSDGSWWNGNGATPRLNYGVSSSFMTMEYSPGPLEELRREPVSAPSIVGVAGGGSLPIMQRNGSGPLRMARSKVAFYRLKGSMSEHGLLLKNFWSEGKGYESSF